jgi:hypothetical protein
MSAALGLSLRSLSALGSCTYLSFVVSKSRLLAFGSWLSTSQPTWFNPFSGPSVLEVPSLTSSLGVLSHLPSTARYHSLSPPLPLTIQSLTGERVPWAPSRNVTRYGGPRTALTIALHRGLYLAIVMHRYREPQTALTIPFHGGLYLPIIMDRYGGPQTALPIALLGGFYLAFIMYLYGGPHTVLTIALHEAST